MKKRGAVYARQSSGSDDYSESVAVQITNSLRLANSMQIEVVDVLSDLNISGKTYPAGWEKLAASDSAFCRWAAAGNNNRQFRSGLGKVMQMLPDIDYIIVDDITRLYRPLSRSFLESAVNEQLIINQVQILQVKGGELDLNKFDQQLIVMLKNQINDEQIAKQRQRSIEVLNKLRNSGIMPTGITAFGLKYNCATKHFTLEPEKIEVVRFIFSSLLSGYSYSWIVRSINQRWRHYFGVCFWEKNLYDIARKPIYAGYQYNTEGMLIPNRQGPPAIPLQDFLDVQQLIAEKKFRNASHCRNRIYSDKRHFLPLSGILYCSNCGSRMVCAIEKGMVSYFCRRGSLCSDPACRNIRIAASCSRPELAGLTELVYTLLAEALLIKLEKFRKSKLPPDPPETPPVSAPALPTELRLQLLCREFLDNNISEKLFRQSIDGIKQHLAAAGTPSNSPGTRQDEFVELELLIDSYCKNMLTNQDYRRLLNEVVARITIYRSKVVIQCGRNCFEFTRIQFKRQKGFDRLEINKLHKEYSLKLKKILVKLKKNIF